MPVHIIPILFSLFFLTSCSLLNGGTVHVKYTKFQTDVDGITYENKQDLGDVSFSVRNIQHPKQFGRWNLNLRLRPSIHYERHTLGTLSTRINDQGYRELYPDIKMRRCLDLVI